MFIIGSDVVAPRLILVSIRCFMWYGNHYKVMNIAHCDGVHSATYLFSLYFNGLHCLRAFLDRKAII